MDFFDTAWAVLWYNVGAMGKTAIGRELACFLAEKAAEGLRPRSVEWYRERLERPLADLGPLPGRDAVVGWLLAWREVREPSLAHYRGVLLALTVYLAHRGVRLGLRLPRVPRYEGGRLSRQQVEALLCQFRCLDSPKEARDAAILSILLDTGLRASELTALTWTHLDWAESRIVVVGKGGHRRFVYFGKRSRAVLRAWRRLAPRGSQTLFCTRDAKPITRNLLYRIVRGRGRRVGLRVHPHMLRRTFATQWVRAGGNIFALQRLLGHSSLEMVRRYVALAESDLALSGGRRGALDAMLPRKGERR